MEKFIAKENCIYLIQIFQKGFDRPPTLKYRLKEYNTHNSMIYVVDPATNLDKCFPSGICTVDEVLEQ
jgi:hypothetical protein